MPTNGSNLIPYNFMYQNLWNDGLKLGGGKSITYSLLDNLGTMTEETDKLLSNLTNCDIAQQLNIWLGPF